MSTSGRDDPFAPADVQAQRRRRQPGWEKYSPILWAPVRHPARSRPGPALSRPRPVLWHLLSLLQQPSTAAGQEEARFSCCPCRAIRPSRQLLPCRNAHPALNPPKKTFYSLQVMYTSRFWLKDRVSIGTQHKIFGGMVLLALAHAGVVMAADSSMRAGG